MVSSLDLSNASLDDEFTDITEFVFSRAQRLSNEVVLKNPSFSLFEGTHALEIQNNKLDTGIIKLTEEELNFDTTAKRSLKEVCWLSDSLLRSAFTWLNNSHLNVTVLSNYYVEELLVNYTKSSHGSIESIKISDDDDDKLLNVVLKAVILGVLQFVKLTISLAQGGVIYEEEDISTQTMGLKIISEVGVDEVLSVMNIALTYLQKEHKDDLDSIIIQNILYILKNLSNLPEYMGLTIPNTGCSIDTSFLDALTNYANFLKSNLDYLNSLPPIPGCYSLGIQKRLDNSLPIKELISYTSEDYLSLLHLIGDFKQIFQISHRTKTTDVINFTLNFANQQHHPIARAFFPLFLIRDDRSILGNEQLLDVLIADMKSFSCLDSQIFQTENSVASQKLYEFLEQVTSAYFEWFSAMNQNPCRQRAHLSRSIVKFDTLQAHSETMELSFREMFQIMDNLEENNEIIASLPISSWIYYIKLTIMIQVVLRGFELDLYKVWEYHQMYWYASYLIDHLFALLQRVMKLNHYKMEQIKAMRAKLKKKKGDQRQRYKQKMERKLLNELPELAKINESITATILKYEVIQKLCHLQAFNLEMIIQSGLMKQPSLSFIKDPQLLYNLRMKPFSTVGVPTFPTYTNYTNELTHNIFQQRSKKNQMDQLRTEISNKIKLVIEKVVTGDETLGFGLCKEQWISWFETYQRSCIGISLNLCKGQDPDSHRIIVKQESFHPYFPVVTIEKK